MHHRSSATLPSVVLSLGCLTALSARAEVTFLGDWADFGTQFQLTRYTEFVGGNLVQWSAGTGENHWAIVQEVNQNRLQVEIDPTCPRPGAVLRVQVSPGDSVGWSGERAEVSHMLNPTGAQFPVTPENGHEVYGVSVNIDPSWQPPLHDNTHGHWQWGIVMQLHSPDASGGPPAFALTATDQFGVSTLAGDLIGSNGQRRNGDTYTLTNGSLRPGHWVQFMLDVVWAYDTHGSLTLYRRDEGQSEFTPVLTRTSVPTLQFNSQMPDSPNPTHYWKVGFYRSISPGVTNILRLGPVVRGSSISEVTAAAFGPSQAPMPPSAVVIERAN